MASGEAERAARDRPGPSTARPAQAASSVPAPEPFSSMSRNNGISFSALPDVSIHDYIKAFSTTTPAECIISTSRISNQRIAVYLKSKENVFSAINNGLTYNNTFIQINPLTLPNNKAHSLQCLSRNLQSNPYKTNLSILQSCLPNKTNPSRFQRQKSLTYFVIQAASTSVDPSQRYPT